MPDLSWSMLIKATIIYVPSRRTWMINWFVSPIIQKRFVITEVEALLKLTWDPGGSNGAYFEQNVGMNPTNIEHAPSNMIVLQQPVWYSHKKPHVSPWERERELMGVSFKHLRLIYALLSPLLCCMQYLYKSVFFEGPTLVYRPDCNAEDGCHANSYWLWQRPEALQEGRYTSVASEQNPAIIIITTWSHNVSSFISFLSALHSRDGALI